MKLMAFTVTVMTIYLYKNLHINMEVFMFNKHMLIVFQHLFNDSHWENLKVSNISMIIQERDY